MRWKKLNGIHRDGIITLSCWTDITIIIIINNNNAAFCISNRNSNANNNDDNNNNEPYQFRTQDYMNRINSEHNARVYALNGWILIKLYF